MKLEIRRQAVIGAALVGLVAAACTTSSAAPSGGDSQLRAGTRTIYMAAIEPKGTTTVQKEPFPDKSLPPGGGYILSKPDPSGSWSVETYRWLPSEITVIQGDKVTLEIVGINGPSHPSRIEGYDISFEVKRGQLTTMTFTADKVGVFNIICAVHGPSMTGSLIVLPVD